VVPDYEAQLRAAREQAFEEGRQAGLDEQRHAMFEQGLRDGIAEGRAAGELEAQRRIAHLHEQANDRMRRADEIGGALAGQWREQLALHMASAENEMVALCHAVICRFLGDSLIDRDGVSRLMRVAIEQWLQAGEKQMREAPVVVRVHPMDLDAMKADETLARWLVQQGVRGIDWQAGDEVALGGCIIQGPDGDLDARLETQLRNLHEQLVRGRESRST
jgi:flagellar assembly protein FliH